MRPVDEFPTEEPYNPGTPPAPVKKSNKVLYIIAGIVAVMVVLALIF